MEQPNEPSTKDIVQNLLERNVSRQTRNRCKWELIAADRLKSQERRIAELTEELEAISESATVLHGANESHWNKIKELTARAEKAEMQIVDFSLDCGTMTETIAALRDELSGISGKLEKAEAERDAAIEDLDVLKDSGFCNSCIGCNAPHSEAITYCTDWTRRGQPQDKNNNTKKAFMEIYK